MSAAKTNSHMNAWAQAFLKNMPFRPVLLLGNLAATWRAESLTPGRIDFPLFLITSSYAAQCLGAV